MYRTLSLSLSLLRHNIINANPLSFSLIFLSYLSLFLSLSIKWLETLDEGGSTECIKEKLKARKKAKKASKKDKKVLKEIDEVPKAEGEEKGFSFGFL